MQHPHQQAVAQCQSCGAFMCATCDFALPGGIHVCPACAATPKTTLSERRKKLLVGAFALAIWSTLVAVFSMSGALAEVVQTESEQQAFGMVLNLIWFVPSIIGLALSLSAMDRRLVNPLSIWMAVGWNGLLLGGHLLLCLRVSDVSGSRVSEVEAPDDVAINRILAVLVERMNLPLNSPDGQLMSYKLHHRRTGWQLLDQQTLAQANVCHGDELRLQPEITAGTSPWHRGGVAKTGGA